MQVTLATLKARAHAIHISTCTRGPEVRIEEREMKPSSII